MAVSALVVTAGSSLSNAYVTRVFADQYHLDRVSPAVLWSTYSIDQKDAAILTATRLMDSLWVWNGYSTTPGTQVLAFPRAGLYDPATGYQVANNVIPVQLQYATAEFARQLLEDDRIADISVQTQGIKSVTAGPVSVVFNESIAAKVVPDAVVGLIPEEWGHVRGRARSAALVSC